MATELYEVWDIMRWLAQAPVQTEVLHEFVVSHGALPKMCNGEAWSASDETSVVFCRGAGTWYLKSSDGMLKWVKITRSDD